VLDRASESVVLAYPKTVLIDGEGRFVGPYEDGLDLRDPTPHRRLRALIRNLVMSNAIFGLIRREALERTRGHGTYVSADYILLAELALQGQFWEIPEPLFLRREHPLMSRRANRTTAELAEWFETGAGSERRTEFVHLFAEYVAALDRAQLSRVERIRTYTTLFPWLRRFYRGMIQELVPGRLSSPPEKSESLSHPPIVTAEQIRVHDAVRDAVWSTAPNFTADVRIHIDPQLAIEGDRAAFNTILVNLVSNAVRYGSPPITIAAEIDEEFTLTVHDEGRGVSPAFAPRLFDPFSRSSESEHASAGLGLGLAVAALSAHEAGGRLTHEATDSGARFRLVFGSSSGTGRPSEPRRIPPRAPAPASHARFTALALKNDATDRKLVGLDAGRASLHAHAHNPSRCPDGHRRLSTDCVLNPQKGGHIRGGAADSRPDAVPEPRRRSCFAATSAFREPCCSNGLHSSSRSSPSCWASGSCPRSGSRGRLRRSRGVATTSPAASHSGISGFSRR
jgi:signal transduction histidine kinase